MDNMVLLEYGEVIKWEIEGICWGCDRSGVHKEIEFPDKEGTGINYWLSNASKCPDCGDKILITKAEPIEV